MYKKFLQEYIVMNWHKRNQFKYSTKLFTVGILCSVNFLLKLCIFLESRSGSVGSTAGEFCILGWSELRKQRFNYCFFFFYSLVMINSYFQSLILLSKNFRAILFNLISFLNIKFYICDRKNKSLTVSYVQHS